MSDMPTDMAKVTQMLDAGWEVRLYRDAMGSYTAEATHPDEAVLLKRTTEWRAVVKSHNNGCIDDEMLELSCPLDHLDTADFTPEQALTRMAYRTLGQHWEQDVAQSGA